MPDQMHTSWFEGLELRSRPLCRAWIDVDPISPMDMGEGPWRRLFAAYIKDGAFEGERLRGSVMPGGGDWPMLSRDAQGVQAVNTRAVWRTHDCAWLYLTYSGRISISPDVRARIKSHGASAVAPSEYYFRSLPTFETSDPRYDWLNNIVCVAVGRITSTGVAYEIYAID